VSGSKEPVDELRATSERLSEGLKTCRSVIDNYRSLISGAIFMPGPPEHPDALNDNAD
jgi:hypothetical protein